MASRVQRPWRLFRTVDSGPPNTIAAWRIERNPLFLNASNAKVALSCLIECIRISSCRLGRC